MQHLCAAWSLAADGFEDEDPGVRKLLEQKSQLEEHAGGFCVERWAPLCLRWIRSGFWAALTLDWS